MYKTKTLRDLLREKRLNLESQRERLDNEYLQLKFMETVLEQTTNPSSEGADATSFDVHRDQGTPTRPEFAFMKHWGHSEEDLATAMESLKIKCQGNNSRALMRCLIELDKEGFLDISDVKAAELYEELGRSFGMPNINKTAFAESYRLIG